ncbi:MAG: hypothetical protein KZQ83_02860 [gamma proteobacterium symbiont of Taylorina sp.]|nr:hypothetical protein [gamma proteobacterium symbiont of Taylorina sp.]
MKYLNYFILLIISAALSGCGSGFADPQVQNYPKFSAVHEKYSSEQINSFKLEMNCSDAIISGLEKEFADNYCPMLKKDIKSFIQAHNPAWKYETESYDIAVSINLEILHGGDFDGRFFFPGNSGSAARTFLYASVSNNNTILAERRIFEYTAFINPLFDKFSNEETIRQDAVSISEKISDFVSNPAQYGSRYAK